MIAALYGEILALRREAVHLAQATAREYVSWGTTGMPRVPFDKHFMEGNRLSEPMLYKALAGKIGLLRPELAQAIIQSHLNIQEARQWVPLLCGNPERWFSYGPVYVLSPAIAAIKDVVPALREIETTLKLQPHEEKFGLKQAYGVVSADNEMYEAFYDD